VFILYILSNRHYKHKKSEEYETYENEEHKKGVLMELLYLFFIVHYPSGALPLEIQTAHEVDLPAPSTLEVPH